MKFIKDLHDGERIGDIYLCKSYAQGVSKTGKPYGSVTLMDKTGTLDCKIWDLNNAGIEDFKAGDFVLVNGDITTYNGSLQAKLVRVRKASEGEYDVAQYVPSSKRDIEEMYRELLALVKNVDNHYLRALLEEFFVRDADFIEKFKQMSAAKSVHHSYVGGLLEHTLSVATLCKFYASRYPVLKKDLLITAALLHDIGKVREFSPFPTNDYTDEGNLLGHIVMGSEMVGEKIKLYEDFPVSLASEIKHCILAHHGKLEFGSPKKPALIEAVALNYADDLDAKMESFREILAGTESTDWLGFNRLFDSNLRATKQAE